MLNLNNIAVVARALAERAESMAQAAQAAMEQLQELHIIAGQRPIAQGEQELEQAVLDARAARSLGERVAIHCRLATALTEAVDELYDWAGRLYFEAKAQHGEAARAAMEAIEADVTRAVEAVSEVEGLPARAARMMAVVDGWALNRAAAITARDAVEGKMDGRQAILYILAELEDVQEALDP